MDKNGEQSRLRRRSDLCPEENCLQEIKPYLESHLNVYKTITWLNEKSVLYKDDVTQIFKSTDAAETVNCLIETIIRKGPDAFDRFTESLQKTGQLLLYRKLIKTLKNSQACAVSSKNASVAPHPSCTSGGRLIERQQTEPPVNEDSSSHTPQHFDNGFPKDCENQHSVSPSPSASSLPRLGDTVETRQNEGRSEHAAAKPPRQTETTVLLDSGHVAPAAIVDHLKERLKESNCHINRLKQEKSVLQSDVDKKDQKLREYEAVITRLQQDRQDLMKLRVENKVLREEVEQLKKGLLEAESNARKLQCQFKEYIEDLTRKMEEEKRQRNEDNTSLQHLMKEQLQALRKLETTVSRLDNKTGPLQTVSQRPKFGVNQPMGPPFDRDGQPWMIPVQSQAEPQFSVYGQSRGDTQTYRSGGRRFRQSSDRSYPKTLSSSYRHQPAPPVTRPPPLRSYCETLVQQPGSDDEGSTDEDRYNYSDDFPDSDED